MVILFFLLTMFRVTAQGDSIEQQEVLINFSSAKGSFVSTGRFYSKQLNFYGKIVGDISVYLNGVLIFSDSSKYVADKANDLALSVPLKKLSKKRYYYLNVLSHSTNSFIEFPVDPRYTFINLYFWPKNDCYKWSILYNNSIPE